MESLRVARGCTVQTQEIEVPAFAAAGPPAGGRRASAGLAARLACYVELVRPRVIPLVLVVTAVGFLLGSAAGPLELARFLGCLLGTALLAGGASALNQRLERREDALMSRTERRPLPSGRLSAREGGLVGAALGAAGVAVLAAACNAAAAALGAATIASYVFVYTPLKRRTSLSLFLGAVPGALPPVIGWAAAGGALSIDALAVFSILFLWQIPHFAAIGWLYREEYRAAGFRVLSARDPAGSATARQIVLFSALLVAASAWPSFTGLSGPLYLAGAVVLGAAFLGFGLRYALTRSRLAARRVLHASLVYLPALFLLLLGDRT